ncbi:MAG TPA: hypothetical protein PKI33_05040 [Anaerolineales bacterium]|nr:hypothetical protein [Anaerolineales bacterium]
MYLISETFTPAMLVVRLVEPGWSVGQYTVFAQDLIIQDQYLLQLKLKLR